MPENIAEVAAAYGISLPPTSSSQSKSSFSSENPKRPVNASLDEFYAFLVGVGNYEHQKFANLPATIRDVKSISALLADPDRCGYPSDQIQTITGPDAKADTIRKALQSLAQSTNSDSTVFIYFSGHGGRARENRQWRTYLCPREADPDDLANTAISGDEFSAALAAIPARRLLVILDACHAGGSADLKAADGTLVWKSGLPEDYYEALSQGSGRVVIASSKAAQYSRVRPEGDLSLFTYHLRDALNGKAAVRGDGLIHVLDVFHYVNEAVQADEPEQTPILKVEDLDLNFPIALTKPRTDYASLSGAIANYGEGKMPKADKHAILLKLLEDRFQEQDLRHASFHIFGPGSYANLPGSALQERKISFVERLYARDKVSAFWRYIDRFRDDIDFQVD
jgi:hypothetical protein